MKNKIGLLILIFLIGFAHQSFGQEYSKHSIKLGIGTGISMGHHTEGSGVVYSVGYQKEIWNDRFRFNPNFSLGQYSSKFLPLDARDQYFNSLNLEADLYFDLLKIHTFSVVIGCGGLINHSKGMKGSDSEYDSVTIPSAYVSDCHFGGFLGGGFRINSPGKRTAFNFMPFNLRFGNHDFLEYSAKIDVDIKF